MNIIRLNMYDFCEVNHQFSKTLIWLFHQITGISWAVKIQDRTRALLIIFMSDCQHYIFTCKTLHLTVKHYIKVLKQVLEKQKSVSAKNIEKFVWNCCVENLSVTKQEILPGKTSCLLLRWLDFKRFETGRMLFFLFYDS